MPKGISSLAKDLFPRSVEEQRKRVSAYGRYRNMLGAYDRALTPGPLPQDGASFWRGAEEFARCHPDGCRPTLEPHGTTD